MRKRAARLGDQATCQDHAVGPIIDASPNVLINGRRAARQQDYGRHRSSERPRFFVGEGAPCVLVNGRQMARQIDRVANVHSIGRIATGSPNVLVGDYGRKIGERTPSKLTVRMTFHGVPLPGVRVKTSTGIDGVTAENGEVTLEGLPHGVTDVFLGELRCWRVIFHGGEWLRLRGRLGAPVDNCLIRTSKMRLARGAKR